MSNDGKIDQLENELNDFDLAKRRGALEELKTLTEAGEVEIKPDNSDLNMHCHTFFSYNGYGYSPSYIAWLTKKSGWFASGIVDFDVLDGVDEFVAASQLLGIRGIAGMETRVFISELADDEINSPGEPGISYHMGVGFVAGKVPPEAEKFQTSLRERANNRTRNIVELVNGYLDPVILDYQSEVEPLTPGGNATERHVCAAYEAKAEEIFADVDQRAKFWAEKLGLSGDDALAMLDDSVKLQGTVRSKTMKSGGVGYATPKPENFPLLQNMNEFIRQCGAIPVATWLNGLSDGEQDVERLLNLHAEYGSVALNIIPDRNWNLKDATEKEKKILELHRIIAAARERNLPIIVGTEMNAPGLKLVDTFTAEALSPYIEDFVNGAAIIYAHTKLQAESKGYLSDWAANEFSSVAEKNAYFINVGKS